MLMQVEMQKFIKTEITNTFKPALKTFETNEQKNKGN